MDTSHNSSTSAPILEHLSTTDSVPESSQDLTQSISLDKSSFTETISPVARSLSPSRTEFQPDEPPVDFTLTSDENDVHSSLHKVSSSECLSTHRPSLLLETSQKSAESTEISNLSPSHSYTPSMDICENLSNSLPRTTIQGDPACTNLPVSTSAIKIVPSFYAAAESGNGNALFEILSTLSQNTGFSPKEILNTPSSSTGLTVLHYAASRGHLILIDYLLDSGAEVDLADREGETALLKAAFSGHLEVVKRLVENDASCNQQDKDGWTALHNACSCGHLEVVKWLLENTQIDVNVKSKMNHTPLMNAASRGYLSIVAYLLNEGNADPSIQNDFGEKAYDVAAARVEAQICELLDEYEKRSEEDYDIISDHQTVLIILNENQRSPQTLLSRLASPRFSIGTLSEIGVHPWTLVNGSPTSKETIQLPFSNSESGLEEEWFWLTDWQIDLKHTKVDPEEGWQYAYSFDAPENKWYRSPPDAGLGSSWVRRRRWIRVMKRKLDVYNMDVDLSFPNQKMNSNPTQIQLGEASSSATRADSIPNQINGYRDICNSHAYPSETTLSNDPQFTDRGSLRRSNTGTEFHRPTLFSYSPVRSSTIPSTSGTQIRRVSNASSSSSDSITSTPSPLRHATNSSMGLLTPLSPSLWESDGDASDCRQCGRRFMLFLRRHHCRRCGLVFCDRCTSSRFPFPNPAYINDTASVVYQRVCDTCFALLKSLPKNSNSLVTSSLMSRSNSQASIMNECPVCFTSLQMISTSKEAQERHVKECLEKREFSSSPRGPRYLVFKLKEDSNLIGQECPICFEEFEQGETLARLTCLCTYHRECIDSWFDRGKQCPFHSG